MSLSVHLPPSRLRPCLAVAGAEPGQAGEAGGGTEDAADRHTGQKAHRRTDLDPGDRQEMVPASFPPSFGSCCRCLLLFLWSVCCRICCIGGCSRVSC